MHLQLFVFMFSDIFANIEIFRQTLFFKIHFFYFSTIFRGFLIRTKLLHINIYVEIQKNSRKNRQICQTFIWLSFIEIWHCCGKHHENRQEIASKYCQNLTMFPNSAIANFNFQSNLPKTDSKFSLLR